MINDIDYINKFYDVLVKNKHEVSLLEFTSGNYDEYGEEIRNEIPTITSNYCEIGSYDSIIYFVFIILPKNFNNIFFQKIKKYSNIKIYNFTDFNATLYPVADFDYKSFSKKILEDKYLQIQFDFSQIDVELLYNEYLKIIKIFQESGVDVINQRIVEL